MQSIKAWIMAHPSLSAWLVLAPGMILILLVEARDVGLDAAQWFWLIAITALVAAACIWIIGWGADEAEAAEAATNGGRRDPVDE